MGDACLKPIVILHFVHNDLKKNDLSQEIHPVIGNFDDCFMPKLFDQYFGPHILFKLPENDRNISSHWKADFVEALLAFCLTCADAKVQGFLQFFRCQLHQFCIALKK